MKFYKKKFSAQNDILTLELKYWILENNFSISFMIYIDQFLNVVLIVYLLHLKIAAVYTNDQYYKIIKIKTITKNH